MNRRRNLISEMNNMLDNKKKITLESVVFSENDDPREYMEDDENDEYPLDDRDSEEKEIPMDNESIDPSVQSDINKIRKICINAIARLASNPKSNDYISMKKIWDLCDKTIESKKESNF